jgi:hypothetical protein
MNNENFEYCKSIAQELEAIINGEKTVCASCGHIIDDDEATICPACESEDLTASDIYSYFFDMELYDIEYTIGSNKEFRGVRLMIACGGPNVYINTKTASVELFWWNEKASYPLAYDVVDAINNYWEEDYNM